MACATNDGSQEHTQTSVVDHATAQFFEFPEATVKQSDTPSPASSTFTNGDLQGDDKALVVCSAAHQPTEPLSAKVLEPDREIVPLELSMVRSNKRKADDDADDEVVKRSRNNQSSE